MGDNLLIEYQKEILELGTTHKRARYLSCSFFAQKGGKSVLQPIANNNDTSIDAKVIAMFLETKKRNSKKTAKVYEGVINEFFKFMDYKPFRAISFEDMVDWSKYLSEPNFNRNPVFLAEKTQNRKISTTKSLFSYAQKVGLIQINPAEVLELKKVDSEISQRILTKNELLSFLRATHEKTSHKMVVYFLIYSGCRVSELANLRWKDIYLDIQGYLCMSILGKGNKRRELKIPAKLWDIIVEYRTKKGLSTEVDPQDFSPLMINKYGEHYSTQSLWLMIKEVTQKSNIKKEVSPHWLRHTFATMIAANDGDLLRLQHDLGHSSLMVTQVYLHIAKGMENTSVDYLDLDYIETE